MACPGKMEPRRNLRSESWLLVLTHAQIFFAKGAAGLQAQHVRKLKGEKQQKAGPFLGAVRSDGKNMHHIASKERAKFDPGSTGNSTTKGERRLV